MQQLEMFVDWRFAQLAAQPTESQEMLVRQPGLFDHAQLLWAEARSALSRFDLARAADLLARLTRVERNDGRAREVLAEVRRLCDLGAGQPEGSVEWLSRLEAEVPQGLRQGWHRCMARALEAERGPGGRASGLAAGHHYLRAGETQPALRSLRESLAVAAGDARVRAGLADALFVSGDVESARREYARALFDDASAIDVGSALDPEVAGLPLIVSDYEVQGPVVDWILPLGIVEGTLPVPALPLPGFAGEGPAGANASPGTRFLAALFEERRSRSLDDRVAARRVMKKLCPEALRRYLERRVGGGG